MIIRKFFFLEQRVYERLIFLYMSLCNVVIPQKYIYVIDKQ